MDATRASVHLVDGKASTGFRRARQRLVPADTPGLLEARWTIAAPFTGAFMPRPQLGRFGLVAFWEDDAAIDRFEHEQPSAKVFAGGWSARLEPKRAVAVAGGHFPGVPDDPQGRAEPDAPAAVITIGWLRLRRAVAFRRTSARAEAQVVNAPGLLWATGLANLAQRIVSTFSLWESTEALRAYAIGTTGHKEALRREGLRSHHHVGSFVRLRPYAVQGYLSGSRNPLPESVTARLNGG